MIHPRESSGPSYLPVPNVPSSCIAAADTQVTRVDGPLAPSLLPTARGYGLWYGFATTAKAWAVQAV